MPVSGSEQGEAVCRDTGFFGLGVEGVTGDDDGGGVAGGSSGLGYTARRGRREADEGGESGSDVFLDEGEEGRDCVYVCVGIEDR